MSDDNRDTLARRARNRALRAAQVATMSALMMGCNMTHRGPTPPGDSGPPEPDSGPIADAGTDAGDPGMCVTMEDANASEDCCIMQGGSWWDERCSWIVEGPRVPPSMSA